MTEEYFFQRLETLKSYNYDSKTNRCLANRLSIYSFVTRNIVNFNIEYSRILFEILGRKINECYEFLIGGKKLLFPNIYTIQFDRIVNGILSKK